MTDLQIAARLSCQYMLRMAFAGPSRKEDADMLRECDRVFDAVDVLIGPETTEIR